MTTTLRPTGPLQKTGDGAQSRSYQVCVNSRPVGLIELGTDPGFGSTVGVVHALHIDEPDRGRGRGTVAALAAEEVLRGWGCEQVLAAAPADAVPALRTLAALGYVERSRNMVKYLAPEPPGLPAGVEARPMTPAEFQDWLVMAQEKFAEHWIARGATPEQARAKSEASHRESLPAGLDTPGVSMWVLVAEGEAVGHVWVARREVRPGERAPYVYDVAVAEDRRGKGYGRALMLLAERIAAEGGASLIGLHVFSDNTPAVRLYESLGYGTTGINFFKRLL